MRRTDVGYTITKINGKAVAVALCAMFATGGVMATTTEVNIANNADFLNTQTSLSTGAVAFDGGSGQTVSGLATLKTDGNYDNGTLITILKNGTVTTSLTVGSGINASHDDAISELKISAGRLLLDQDGTNMSIIIGRTTAQAKVGTKGVLTVGDAADVTANKALADRASLIIGTAANNDSVQVGTDGGAGNGSSTHGQNGGIGISNLYGLIEVSAAHGTNSLKLGGAGGAGDNGNSGSINGGNGGEGTFNFFAGSKLIAGGAVTLGGTGGAGVAENSNYGTGGAGGNGIFEVKGAGATIDLANTSISLGGTGGNSANSGTAAGNGGNGTITVTTGDLTIATTNASTGTLNLGGAGGGTGTTGGKGGDGKIEIKNGAALTLNANTGIMTVTLGGATSGNGGKGELLVDGTLSLATTADKTIGIKLGADVNNAAEQGTFTLGATALSVGQNAATMTVSSTADAGKTTITVNGASNNANGATINNGATLNVGNASGFGLLTLTGNRAGLDITNGNLNVTSNANNQSILEIGSNSYGIRIAKGTLTLAGGTGEGHKGAKVNFTADTTSVVLSGTNNASDAKLVALGGTKTNPNIINGSLTGTKGTVEIGKAAVGSTAAQPAFLKVNGANNTLSEGSLTVNTGSLLKFDATNSALTVGGSNAGTVTAQALGLNSSVDAGLMVKRLTISSNGTLDIGGDLSIDPTKLTGAISADGDLFVNTGGTLKVKTLTLEGTAANTAHAGTIVADKIVAKYNTADQALQLNSGTTTILGAAKGSDNKFGAAIVADGVTISGGATTTLNLGEADSTLGGSYAGALTLTKGALNVKGGTWTLNNNNQNTSLSSSNDVALTVSGGTLNLVHGTASSNSVVTADMDNAITVSGGTLHVNKLTIGSNASSAGGLLVTGGTVNVDDVLTSNANGLFKITSGTVVAGKLDVGGNGVSIVGSHATKTATLTITGNTGNDSTGDVKIASGKLDLDKNGIINLQSAAVVKNLGAADDASGQALYTGIATMAASNKGGTINLIGIDSISKGQLAGLASKLVTTNASMTVYKADGKTLSTLTGFKEDGTEALTDGLKLTTIDTQIAGNTTIEKTGTASKTVNVITNTGLTTITVQNNGTFALVGDDTLATQLVNNKVSGGTNAIKIQDGGLFDLGLHGGAATKGTFTGNIAFAGTTNGGELRVIKDGEFKVTGTVNDGGKNATLTLQDASEGKTTKLETGAITQTGTTSKVVLGERAELVATAASSVKEVDLGKNATAKVTNGTLTVATLDKMAEGATLESKDKLTITAVGTNALAGTIKGTGIGVKGSNAVTAAASGLKIDAGTGDADFSTGTANLVATDGTLTLTAGTVKMGANALNVTTNGSSITADKLVTTGNITLEGKDSTAKLKQLTAGSSANVTLDKGAVVAVAGAAVGDELSTIGGNLNLGTAYVDAANQGGSATMSVANNLTVSQNVNILGGSSLTVEGTFKSDSGKTVTVGNANDQAGSSLRIGTLKGAGAKFMIDPTDYIATVGIKEVEASGAVTKGTLDDSIIVGRNAIVAIGMDVAEATKQTRAAGWLVTGNKGAEVISSAASGGSVLALGKALTIGAGQQLVAGNNFTLNAGTIKHNGTALAANTGFALQDNALLIVDQAAFGADGTGAAITLSNNNNVIIDKSAGLLLNSSKLKLQTGLKLVDKVGTVTQTKTGAELADTVLSAAGDNNKLIKFDDVDTTNRLLGIDEDSIKYVYGAGNTGSITFDTYVENIAETFPGAASGMNTFLTQFATNVGIDLNHANAGVRFVSSVATDSALSDVEAVRTLEGAAQAAVVGAVPGMTASVAQAGVNAVAGRIGMSAPTNAKIAAFTRDDNGNYQKDTGVAAGNGRAGVGIWAMPLYQDIDASGFKSGSQKTGYDADYAGIAFGGDYTMGNVRIGLAANVGSGDSDSSGRFNKTKNDFDFWGLNAYGAYTQGNLGLSADIGYTDGDSSIKQRTPLAGFAQLKANVDSRAWTMGVRAEYKVAGASVDVIPYVGLRYTKLDVDSYRLKSTAGDVFHVKGDSQNIWSIPLGVTLTKDIQTAGGWTMKPRADIGLIASGGDRKATSKFTVPGVGGLSYHSLKTETYDRTTFDGGLGFDATKGKLTLGLKYNIQKSSNVTNQGITGNLRYDF